jgi:hypothetical protein
LNMGPTTRTHQMNPRLRNQDVDNDSRDFTLSEESINIRERTLNMGPSTRPLQINSRLRTQDMDYDPRDFSLSEENINFRDRTLSMGPTTRPERHMSIARSIPPPYRSVSGSIVRRC